MRGNNGKLREFKGIRAEPPAGFEVWKLFAPAPANEARFGNVSALLRILASSPRLRARCEKNAIVAFLPETFFPNPASFFQNQTSRYTTLPFCRGDANGPFPVPHVDLRYSWFAAGAIQIARTAWRWLFPLSGRVGFPSSVATSDNRFHSASPPMEISGHCRKLCRI